MKSTSLVVAVVHYTRQTHQKWPQMFLKKKKITKRCKIQNSILNFVFRLKANRQKSIADEIPTFLKDA